MTFSFILCIFLLALNTGCTLQLYGWDRGGTEVAGMGVEGGKEGKKFPRMES